MSLSDHRYLAERYTEYSNGEYPTKHEFVYLILNDIYKLSMSAESISRSETDNTLIAETWYPGNIFIIYITPWRDEFGQFFQ